MRASEDGATCGVEDRLTSYIYVFGCNIVVSFQKKRKKKRKATVNFSWFIVYGVINHMMAHGLLFSEVRIGRAHV